MVIRWSDAARGERSRFTAGSRVARDDAFYLKLRAAGKKPKVALVACMRKLVVLMNRLLKNENFQLAN